MLTADRRRKEPRTVDRPAHVKAAGKAAAKKGLPKPAGGQAMSGFAAFRAMATQHSAFKAPAALPSQPTAAPIQATALPAATSSDESSVGSGE